MKKILFFSLLLSLILISCGPKKEVSATPEAEVSKPTEVVRSAEEEQLDKRLILLLREQLSEGHSANDAEFKFVARDDISGFDCFVYEMKSGEVVKNYAVAIDETAIFEINSDGTHTEIYNVK